MVLPALLSPFLSLLRERNRGAAAQRLRAPFSPLRLVTPVCFPREDQCPSSAASGLVSFGTSEEEIAIDDSISLTASDAEEWCVSGEEPKALPSSQLSRPKPDSELIHVRSKLVEDLGLEWSAPDEPAHDLLDEWLLPGRHQPPSRQWPAPFLPAVHEELTKTWRAPYSARVSPSSSAALTTVDGAEEKGYSKLPPLEEAVDAHLCPPSALGLKAHAAHSSRPCWTTLAAKRFPYQKRALTPQKSRPD